MLTVATNTGALMAQAAASSVNRDMETSMQRLSSGKRINAARDDAAGMAISSRLESSVRGLNQSIRNALDGQALLDTAEGAMQETEALLQRIRELAVQAANDTNSHSDRAALETELTQLRLEIDRIGNSTTWAGQNLLDGTFTNKNFHVSGGSNSVDQLTTSINATNWKGIDAEISTKNPSLSSGGVSAISEVGRLATFDVLDIGGIIAIRPLNDGHFAILDDHDTIRVFARSGALVAEILAPNTTIAGIFVSDEGYLGVQRSDSTVDYYSYEGAFIKTTSWSLLSNTEQFDNSISSAGFYYIAVTENYSFEVDILNKSVHVSGYNWNGSGTTFSPAIDKSEAGADNFDSSNYSRVLRGLSKDRILVLDYDGSYILGSVYSATGDKIGKAFSLEVSEWGGTTAIYQGGSYTGIWDVTETAEDELIFAFTKEPETLTDYELADFALLGNNDHMKNVALKRVNIFDGAEAGEFHLNSSEVVFQDGDVMDATEHYPTVTRLYTGEVLAVWHTYDENGDLHWDYQIISPNAFNIGSSDAAKNTITRMDTALDILNNRRATLGAIVNRLDHIVANNTNISVNIAASIGRIKDADFANETTNLAKTQILQQASTAMLAQANAAKQNVLSLLQG